MAEEEIDFQLFRYDPSLAAAVLFTVLFALVTVLHTYQYFVTKCWFYSAFVFGGWRTSKVFPLAQVSADILQSKPLDMLL
jgi:hypothetical protein